ncbi:Amidohydrolase_family protein [Hexamita inflata]|uniref:Amidohydrolase family protein n=1 Tax=Hexamita inflata TaxID=28002 RepID=A0AA86PG48_9EUKA|nr:Amidohydrolase family protein [Hexamita inflata]
MIYINGQIHTMMDHAEVCSAMIVRDQIIIETGTTEQILKLQQQGEQIIDLQKNCVVPGFNDSHMHFICTGLCADEVKLHNSRSIQEIQNECKQYLLSNADCTHISGTGWSEQIIDNSVYPTKEDLDLVSTQIPIVISRICMHIGVANSAALQLYEAVTSKSLTEEQKQSGLIKESQLFELQGLLPQPSVDKLHRIILKQQAALNAVGITSVQSDDLFYVNAIQAYEQAQLNNELTVRVHLQRRFDRKSIEGPFLTNGPLKFFADGSLGAKTAALQEPYLHSDQHGLMLFTDNELKQKLTFQSVVHAIGDAAITQVVNTIHQLDTQNANRSGIVHFQITTPEIIEKVARGNILLLVQPVFLLSDHELLNERISSELQNTSYSWNSCLKQKIHLSFGTDAPIESFNPLLNIYAAVTRRSKIGVLNANECLTVEESVKCYTAESAYAEFKEQTKGKLAKGFLADFVVLEKDIFTINQEEIKDVRVLQTYVGGKKVFDLQK